MNQSDLELQLKVWKELAINNQMLMQTAGKALSLKADCSSEELEEALNKAIGRAKEIELEMHRGNDKAKREIAELTDKLSKLEAERKGILADKDAAIAAQQAAEEKLALGKTANAEELKKIKAQLADKQKEIKQITKTLADTPENVVKKLKALKKEKLDEANLRKRAEEVSRTLRKDKQKVEQDLKESSERFEQAGKLVVSQRELHKFANEQYDRLVEVSKDKKALVAVPALDEALLEAFESESKSDDEDAVKPAVEKDAPVKKEKKKAKK